MYFCALVYFLKKFQYLFELADDEKELVLLAESRP